MDSDATTLSAHAGQNEKIPVHATLCAILQMSTEGMSLFAKKSAHGVNGSRQLNFHHAAVQAGVETGQPLISTCGTRIRVSNWENGRQRLDAATMMISRR